MIVDLTPLFYLFTITAAGYYLMLSFLWLCTIRRTYQAIPTKHQCFTLLIPCANEEGVIKNTLDILCTKINYNQSQYEIVVINDGSQDTTEQRIKNYAKTQGDVKIHLVNVPPEISQQGKGAALNFGYRYAYENSEFRHLKNGHWIIGVFDADGRPQDSILLNASREFDDPAVGAVNSSIRIKNRQTNTLALMQDIEFSVITRLLNIIRSDLFQRAYMGGNGQFMRADILESLCENGTRSPWDKYALAEDMDIGLRISTGPGAKSVQLRNTYVYQEGHESLWRLFWQRVRWSWGAFQSLKYIFCCNIYRSGTLNLAGMIDTTMTLLNPVITVTVFPATLVLIVLYELGIIDVVLPHGISLELAWLIPAGWIVVLLVFMMLSQHHGKRELLYRYPLVILYIFMQIFPMFVGFGNCITCRYPAWVKSDRVEASSSIGSGSPRSQWSNNVNNGFCDFEINTPLPTFRSHTTTRGAATPAQTPKSFSERGIRLDMWTPTQGRVVVQGESEKSLKQMYEKSFRTTMNQLNKSGTQQVTGSKLLSELLDNFQISHLVDSIVDQVGGDIYKPSTTIMKNTVGRPMSCNYTMVPINENVEEEGGQCSDDDIQSTVSCPPDLGEKHRRTFTTPSARQVKFTDGFLDKLDQIMFQIKQRESSNVGDDNIIIKQQRQIDKLRREVNRTRSRSRTEIRKGLIQKAKRENQSRFKHNEAHRDAILQIFGKGRD